MFGKCAATSCDQAIEFCGAQLHIPSALEHEHSRLRSENIYNTPSYKQMASPTLLDEEELDRNIRRLRSSIATDERRSSEAAAELNAIRQSYENKRNILRNLQKKQDSLRTEVECTNSKKMVLQRRIAELEVCADICKDGLNDKTEELRQLQEQCKVLEAKAIRLSQCELETIRNVADMHKQLTVLFNKSMTHTALDRPETRYQSPSRESISSVQKQEVINASDRIDTTNTLESSFCASQVAKSPVTSKPSLLPYKLSPPVPRVSNEVEFTESEIRSGVQLFNPQNTEGLCLGLIYHSMLDDTPRVEVSTILGLIGDLREAKDTISKIVWKTCERSQRGACVEEGDIVAVKPIVLHRDSPAGSKVVVHKRVQRLCGAIAPYSSAMRKYFGHRDTSKDRVSRWLSLHKEHEDVFLDVWTLPEDHVKQCAIGESSYGGLVIGSNLIIFALRDNKRPFTNDQPVVSDVGEYMGKLLSKYEEIKNMKMYDNDKYLYSTNSAPVLEETAAVPRTPIASTPSERPDTPAFSGLFDT